MTQTIVRPEVKTKYSALVELNGYDVVSITIIKNEPEKVVIKHLTNTRVLGLLSILDYYENDVTVIIKNIAPSSTNKIIPIKLEQRKIPMLESNISLSSFLRS